VGQQMLLKLVHSLEGMVDQPAVSYRQTLSHNVVSNTPRHERNCYQLISATLTLLKLVGVFN
jgi:hypothetical protein